MYLCVRICNIEKVEISRYNMLVASSSPSEERLVTPK